MNSRIAAALLVLALAGCANEPNAAPFAQSMSNLGALVLTPADLSNASTDDVSEAAKPRKTIATKVLSAMAFERVTGRKADPARLLEID